MSWSATFEVDQSADEQVKRTSISGCDTKEAQAAHDAGLIAAVNILTQGVVGTGDKKYQVNLSGHANPDFEPADGWSNDYIEVKIYQR